MILVCSTYCFCEQMNWEFCTVICVHCPNSQTIEALLCCEILQWWTPPNQISESSRGMVPESVTCIWHHLVWMFRPWISVTVIALVCLGFAIWLGKQLALSTVCPSYIHSLCIDLRLTHGFERGHRTECLWPRLVSGRSDLLTVAWVHNVPWFLAQWPQYCA